MGKCEFCPLLAAAAELEDFAHAAGVHRDYGSERAILVGVLRGKHGCRGADRSGNCPWLRQLSYNLGGLSPDHAVPEIRPKHDDDPGLFL